MRAEAIQNTIETAPDLAWLAPITEQARQHGLAPR
jgi:hypothetical protein